jgi:hypothetical protein
MSTSGDKLTGGKPKPRDFSRPARAIWYELVWEDLWWEDLLKKIIPGRKALAEYLLKHTEKRHHEGLEEDKCKKARRGEEWERNHYRPVGDTNRDDILPRSMQILAEETDPFEGGFKFPYPRALAKCDIKHSDWMRIQGELIGKFEPCGGGRFHHAKVADFQLNTIAKNIETVLDNAAELDTAFFRPRGLIMRLDMPGEQKFGLDGMDLYFGSTLAVNLPVHNVSRVGYPFTDAGLSEESSWRFCRRCCWTKDTPNSHHRAIRRKFFEGTRIVIDSLTVLSDPQKAHQRGWTNWIQQCKVAEKGSVKDEDESLPARVFLDKEDIIKYIRSVELYFTPKLMRPISERVFRWPPSKQIYYDRWRGHTASGRHEIQVGRKYYPKWVPWTDSMDKRMETQWTQRCVVPADDIGVLVMERECVPKDRCHRRRHKPKYVSKFATGRRAALIRNEKPFPPLPSEIQTELLTILAESHPNTAAMDYYRRYLGGADYAPFAPEELKVGQRKERKELRKMWENRYHTCFCHYSGPPIKTTPLAEIMKQQAAGSHFALWHRPYNLPR